MTGCSSHAGAAANVCRGLRTACPPVVLFTLSQETVTIAFGLLWTFSVDQVQA